MLKEKWCYLNGEILPLNDAKINVDDIGIMRSYGINEALQTYKNKPLFVKDHLKRFRNSADALRLKIPISDDEIEKVIMELISKSNFNETNIRMVLTGGRTVNGIDFDHEKPTFFMITEEHKHIFEEIYEKGCKVITFEYQRPFPELKTTNYLVGVHLQKNKKEAGAMEILYTSGGKILEAATSNFFLVQGNTLVTPKKNVLPGITKFRVIEAVRGVFTVEERDMLVQEFDDATEAFLTASYKDVLPVVQIDDKKVGKGTVGENTKKVMELFKKYVENYTKTEYG